MKIRYIFGCVKKDDPVIIPQSKTKLMSKFMKKKIGKLSEISELSNELMRIQISLSIVLSKINCLKINKNKLRGYFEKKKGKNVDSFQRC